MNYEELAKVNVNEHIEKKNGLSYLSWAWAVDYMTRLDPESGWEYREWDGKPYMTLPDGSCMVYCTVSFNGKKRTAHLPVMDYKNKAISNPDAFAINTAMQRVLVKAIALHGLGLYIYAGEDLPEGEKVEKEAKKGHSGTDGALDALHVSDQALAKAVANSVVDLWNDEKTFAAYEAYYEAGLSNEVLLGVWEILRPYSAIRSGLKKMHKEAQLATTA
jgi:hypothetical protein